MLRGISLKTRAAAASAVIAGLLAWPAQARQPFSESLVECSAIQNMFRTRMERTNPDRDPELMARGKRQEIRLLEAAIRQAEAEGVADVEGYLARLIDEKRESYAGKSQFWVLSGEAKDWIDYCRKFSREMGVKPINED